MALLSHLREHVATREDRVATTMIVVLLLVLGYAVGYWSRGTKEEIPIVFQGASGRDTSSVQGGGNDLLSEEDLRALTSPLVSPPPLGSHAAGSGAYVASVSGAKYYTPDCSQVSRMKEENRVWFDSEADARAAGYEPSVCVTDRSR